MHEFIAWLPPLAWMGVIFYLSGRTGSELHSLFPFIKDFNPGHFLAYFILGSLVYRSLTRSAAIRHAALWTVFFSIVYGLTDEFHQSFVPGRSPELRDLLNDTAGAVLSVLLYEIYKAKALKKRKGAIKK